MISMSFGAYDLVTIILGGSWDLVARFKNEITLRMFGTTLKEKAQGPNTHNPKSLNLPS